MVMTMANAFSGLYLSIVFENTMVEVCLSYGLTICWIERAVALSTPGAAIMLAMPFAMTGSAFASFILYRLAAWALSEEGLDEVSLGTKDDNEQLAAFVAVAYIALVVVITAMTARIFMSLKPSTWFATPSLAEAHRSLDLNLSNARSVATPTILV